MIIWVIILTCEDFIEKLPGLEGKVAITALGNPDPDAIASAFALGRLFETMNVDFGYLFESEINRPENQLLVNYLEIDIDTISSDGFDGYDHVSLVDCNQSRLSANFKQGLRKELEEKLLSVQDHHSIDDDDNYPLKKDGVFVDIRPEMGCCATILSECLVKTDVGFEEKTATALYYGLHSDTNGMLRGFNLTDFEQVINYVDKIDREALTEIVGAVMTSETFEIIHRVTDRELYEVRGTYKFADAGTLTSKNRAAIPQVADLLLREEGIEGIVVAGIDLDDNLVLGSVRYSGSRYTAEEIAAKIAEGVGSGGGHVEMGGFQINPGVLVDTLQKESTQTALLESIKERFFNVVGKSSEG